MMTIPDPEAIVDFWFSEEGKPFWFNSTPEMDAWLREQYAPLVEQALAGELDQWQASPQGALALVIILDQFPLNIYRGTAKSFVGEGAARKVADLAIERGLDDGMPDVQKAFMYLPFMHSENLADQDRSVDLYRQAGLTENLKWAEHHRDIVRRFGRFPHRNDMLARECTPDEEAYLASEEGFHG